MPRLGGRKAPSAEQLARAPKLSKYLSSSLPTPPPSLDYSLAAVPCLSQIMGNDKYGDCTFAGLGHALGLWTGNAGNLVTLTTDQVLAMYSAVTGFNPNDPSTDNGADEITVIEYAMNTGLPDGTKVGAYCSVDPKNQLECMLAMWLGESLYFGVGLPDSWVNPFPAANGFVWDAAPQNDANGHCFIGTGYNAQGVTIDTWGLLGTVTWAAMAESVGQLYCLWSEASLIKATQKTPAGFDWIQLLADCKALPGTPNSPPGPLSPPPSTNVVTKVVEAVEQAVADVVADVEKIF